MLPLMQSHGEQNQVLGELGRSAWLRPIQKDLHIAGDIGAEQDIVGVQTPGHIPDGRTIIFQDTVPHGDTLSAKGELAVPTFGGSQRFGMGCIAGWAVMTFTQPEREFIGRWAARPAPEACFWHMGSAGFGLTSEPATIEGNGKSDIGAVHPHSKCDLRAAYIKEDLPAIGQIPTVGDTAEADPRRGINKGGFSIIRQGITWWNQDGASQGRGQTNNQGRLWEGIWELHAGVVGEYGRRVKREARWSDCVNDPQIP